MPDKIEIEAALSAAVNMLEKQKRDIELMQRQLVAFLPSYRRETGPARVVIPDRKHERG